MDCKHLAVVYRAPNSGMDRWGILLLSWAVGGKAFTRISRGGMLLFVINALVVT